MSMRNIFCAIFLVLIWVTVCSAQTNKQSYINWLQQHNAWEILNQKLESLSPTPENILTRAKYLQRMNRPHRALDILQNSANFSNSTLAADRLLLQAKVYRQQKQHYKAMQNYLMASGYIPSEKYRKKLGNKSEVKWYCQTVCRKWFWENYSGGDAKKNLDKRFFDILELATGIWPNDKFWHKLERELVQSKPGTTSPANTENRLDIPESAKNKTIQALLVSAIGDMSQGRELLMSVDTQEIKFMWARIFSGIFDRDFVNSTSANRDSRATYPKYRAFEDFVYPELEKLSSKQWMVKQPKTSSWINFRSRISSLDVEKALEKIKRELSSTLLNKNLESLLKKYAFIYALLSGKDTQAERFWGKIEPENRSLSLDLAGFVLGFSSSFAQGKPMDESRHPNFPQFALILKNSLHNGSVSSLHTPFWIKEFKNSYSNVSTNFPLDFLANYSLHNQEWSRNPSLELAKSVSLLYPSSLLQNRACIWLAKRAHEDNNPNKAWAYLQETGDGNIKDKGMHKDYLKAKAGLLMEQERKEESLQTYKKLLAKYPQSLEADKKLSLAILSQRLDDWEWAEKTLLDLWENRQGLSSELKAETLFWLGEGAEHKGQEQRAKDYYFRLAWQYPQENMWAVTALHRAALICKNQGQLFTARSILQKVKKEAEQESQKKQAEKVLSWIEKRLGQKEKTTQLLY